MRLGTILPLIGIMIAGSVGCAGKRPQGLGVDGTRLTSCPKSPNCVSTQDEDPEKRMDPLAFEGEQRQAVARLLSILRHYPRAKLTNTIALEGTPLSYISAEFSSRIFGFVDDVEFVVDGEAKLIHFRSASRLGYYDFGANRGRMEEISREFSKKP